jgi:hypothetical protein
LKAKANSEILKRLLPYLTIRLILGIQPSWEHSEKHKGKANAKKPNIPMMGAIPLEAASTNKVPTIPVQEKDTIASANAINKIPIIPPLSA